MSLHRLLSGRATVVTQTPGSGGTDALGRPVTAQKTITGVPCRVRDVSSDEGVAVVTRFRAYFHPNAPVDHTSRVTVDGREFEVDGVPAVLATPGQPRLMTAYLRLVHDGGPS